MSEDHFALGVVLHGLHPSDFAVDVVHHHLVVVALARLLGETTSLVSVQRSVWLKHADKHISLLLDWGGGGDVHHWRKHGATKGVGTCLLGGP